MSFIQSTNDEWIPVLISDVFIDRCVFLFQFSAGVQLLGAVCVLHHPWTPEVCQPRPLHPGTTLSHTHACFSIHILFFFHFLHCIHICLLMCWFVSRQRHRQPCKQVGGFRCCWLRRKSQAWSTNPNSYPIISPSPLSLCFSCFSER